MTATPILTLLTDFGLEDPYVGIMKGVVLTENSAQVIVDLTHAVPPQDLRVAAFWVERSFRWFPAGSVHVAVVDPGVGTTRRPVAVRANGHYFVGPDNGIFSAVVTAESNGEAREIDVSAMVIESRTFHGRDVFARVGARIARDPKHFARVGPVVALAEPAWPRAGSVARAPDGSLFGEVLWLDRFGNAITNLEIEPTESDSSWVIEACGQSLPLCGTYGDVNVGESVALVSSFGTIEVAVREGSAAERGLAVGTAVVARRTGGA